MTDQKSVDYSIRYLPQLSDRSTASAVWDTLRELPAGTYIVAVYPDDWVPMSYGYRRQGEQIELTVISERGSIPRITAISRHEIDTRRSYGSGPSATIWQDRIGGSLIQSI